MGRRRRREILPAMTDSLPVIAGSVDRLADLVRSLDDDALVRPAYPTEWRICDVLSHIGSGAVIWSRLAEDGLAGTPTPDDFNPSVWAEWNAKSPRSQADDCLVVDRRLVDRLADVADEERARLHVSLGPMELGWDDFLRMRMGEHVVHEWDVAVALDPTATLADDGAAILVDQLGAIAGFASKPVGEPGTIVVATTGPGRSFAITIDEGVTLEPAAADADARADVTMPAEAFVRLVYGRLDPDHTPAAVTGDPAIVDRLRQVFTGF